MWGGSLAAPAPTQPGRAALGFSGTPSSSLRPAREGHTKGAKGQDREHREVPSALWWREDVDLPEVTQELMRASNKMQEHRHQPHLPEPSRADPHKQRPAHQSWDPTLGVSLKGGSGKAIPERAAQPQRDLQSLGNSSLRIISYTKLSAFLRHRAKCISFANTTLFMQEYNECRL